jgi:hypothetical protein
MTDETRTDNPVDDLGVAIAPQRQKLLPGLVAIGLYMLVLALVSVLGVVSHQVQPAFLIFSALFITAALGLMLMLRWAWALTLAAVALLVGLFAWKFYELHELPFLVQGLMNLVFFFYLVRTEVRKRLR